jgi:heparan-alpha-glucosaminide N-acetyltransferase
MTKRILSVDIFRAVTMLLMIFVNDLWTLHGVPGWLEHTAANEDGMGLADTVFPAFLFIVGLSIPFAIGSRMDRGDSKHSIFLHILRRTLALVLMGFFMVNQENFSHEAPEMLRKLWDILMIIAFILIWNNYEGKKVFGKVPVWILQVTGIAILLVLAFVYKGGTAEDPHWMRPHWWGILGLIGWAYLVCACIYLFSQNRMGIIIPAWIILMLFNLLEVIPLRFPLPHFLLMVSASNHVLVMSGVLVTMIYLRIRDKENFWIFGLVLLLLAALCIAYGFRVRPYGGISKILATPSWTSICAGISMVAFLIIFIIADVWHYSGWASVIMPAGQSTLTCYLVPGLLYPILYPLQQLLPASLLTGIAGLVKSLLFALLTVIITGWLQKIHIRLKI